MFLLKIGDCIDNRQIYRNNQASYIIILVLIKRGTGNMLQRNIYEIEIDSEEDYEKLIGIDIVMNSKIDRCCSLGYYELIGYMGTKMIVISSNVNINEIKHILSSRLNENYKVRQLQMYTAEVLNEKDQGVLREIIEGRAIYLQRNKKNGKYYFEDDTTDSYVNIVAIDPLIFRDLYCLFRLF
ncbi:hypothetical protein [Clostridium sp.]|uniref:hypothetical protein n=1 Tax=Clostridium sp. TaxID=1506 RepID=UPI002FC81BBC